jgi:enoyl-CoA hydratase/carnithine racemase
MTAAAKPMPEEPVLLRDDAGGVATLTLNRPQARNALSVALLDALQAEFDAIATDQSVHVVVVAANGPAFCAGHDMKEVRANPGLDNYQALFEQSSRLMKSIIRLPQPVIAKVHATATAAGCQLAATCDLVVAASTAHFATPGVNIGLFCSTPMVALSRAVGRKQAMEMLLTGEFVDAERARQMGLVSRVAAPERLDDEVAGLAALVASKSPLTLAIGKEAFYRQADLDLDAAYACGAEAMARNMTARDAEEGIDAFLEKRQPKWEGR